MKQPWEYASTAEELADLRAEVKQLTALAEAEVEARDSADRRAAAAEAEIERLQKRVKMDQAENRRLRAALAEQEGAPRDP